MDFSKFFDFLKNFLFQLFNTYGVTEEFEALGVDIGALLGITTEEPSEAAGE